MEGRSSLKRSFVEDEHSNKPPSQKRVRFPKGKKVKVAEEVVDKVDVVEGLDGVVKPEVAAKERSKRRNQLTAEIFDDSRANGNDISAAEVTYEDDENFDDDGIQVEPFNLNKEREEGYFDKDGNYVEFVNEKEIKDAWLDNVDIDPKYAGKKHLLTSNEDDTPELSAEEIGRMKRRIADWLEPGETVLQALRRLKGTVGRKAKMSEETKFVFDQLTEDAMKLMENGEYNVYSENKEVFEREAEGYEKLARGRIEGTSLSSGEGTSSCIENTDLFPRSMVSDVAYASLSDPNAGTVDPGVQNAEVSGSVADEYDMFADEDEPASTKHSHNASNIGASHNPDEVSQPSSDALNQDSKGGAVQDDYVYDESSGYYYSYHLGYYYDPSTGLYCSAASGQWYSFNEETGAYEEFHGAASDSDAQ